MSMARRRSSSLEARNSSCGGHALYQTLVPVWSWMSWTCLPPLPMIIRLRWNAAGHSHSAMAALAIGRPLAAPPASAVPRARCGCEGREVGRGADGCRASDAAAGRRGGDGQRDAQGAKPDVAPATAVPHVRCGCDGRSNEDVVSAPCGVQPCALPGDDCPS